MSLILLCETNQMCWSYIFRISDFVIQTQLCTSDSMSNNCGCGLVQWLKLPAWKIADHGFRPSLWHSGFEEKIISSSLTRKDLILWEVSLNEGSTVTTRAWISSPVSRGQCPIIHRAILRFSWPDLAYIWANAA